MSRFGSAVLLALAGTTAQVAPTPAPSRFHVDFLVQDSAGALLPKVRLLVTDAIRGGDPWRRDLVVLARLETDARGRTRFEGDAELLTPPTHYFSVFACAPGHRLLHETFSAYFPPEDEPHLLVLGDVAPTTLHFTRPDGTPLGGARVTPGNVGTMRANPPEEIAAALAVTTDATGEATFSQLASAELHEVDVASDELGLQTLWFDRLTPDLPIALAPAASLRGRVVFPPGATPHGLRLRARTVLAGRARQPNARAIAVAELDADGRFAFGPLMRASSISFEFEDATAPWFIPPRPWSDGDAELELKAEPTVLVRGRVVGADDATPVAGAHVNVGGVPPRQLRSDADGRFAFAVTRLHPPNVLIEGVPSPWLEPKTGVNVELGADAGPVELAPIRLERGVRLTGVVRDEKGEAVAGAWIRVTGRREEQNRLLRATMTDADGRFEIAGLARGAEVEVTASGRGRQLVESKTTVTLDADRSLELALAARPTSAARLHVTDASGAALPRARVNLFDRYVEPQYGMVVEHRALVQAGGPPHADDAGDLVAETALERGHRYRFAADAPGFSPAVGAFFEGGGDAGFASTLALAPLSKVRGRVVDRQGKPVGHAQVVQSGDGPTRTRATTADDGAFELDGFVAGKVFLFVQAEGFRFAGASLTAPASDVTVVVARRDEPPRRRLEMPPPPLSRADELKMARAFLEPRVDAARAKPDDGPNERLLEVALAADPRRGYGEAAQIFTSAWFRDYARRPIAREALATDLDEGLALANSMETAQFRAACVLDALDVDPDLPAARRRELLFDALAHARTIDAPAMRVVYLAKVARAFAERDDPELARRIFAEASPNADKLGSDDWEDYAKASFAENLAVFEPTRALALIADLKDRFEFDRHHGNVALVLAARDPARAQESFDAMRESFQRDQWAPRVVYRMAAADLPRARRLADTIVEPPIRAIARFALARALIEAERNDEARAELAEGYRRLAAIAADVEVLTNYNRCAAALGLAYLPLVEQVAPDEVDERLWQSLSFRREPREITEVSDVAAWRLQRDGTIALALARYDRDAAAHLLARFEPWLDELAATAGEECEALLCAQMATDPELGLRWLETAATRPPDEVARTRRNYFVSGVLKMLVQPPDERWTHVLEVFLGVVPFEKEDV